MKFRHFLGDRMYLGSRQDSYSSMWSCRNIRRHSSQKRRNYIIRPALRHTKYEGRIAQRKYLHKETKLQPWQWEVSNLCRLRSHRLAVCLLLSCGPSCPARQKKRQRQEAQSNDVTRATGMPQDSQAKVSKCTIYCSSSGYTNF